MKACLLARMRLLTVENRFRMAWVEEVCDGEVVTQLRHIEIGQHFAQRQGCVAPSKGAGLAGFDRLRCCATAIDGQQEQQGPLGVACGLNQCDRPGDGGLARLHRRNGCLPTVGFRADIEPHSRAIALHRFNVFNDEAFALVLCQRPDGEVWSAFRALGLQVVVCLRPGHSANEAKAARSGKLHIHIPALAVLLEQRVVDAVLASGEHGASGAAQAVFVPAHPVVQSVHHILGVALKRCLRCAGVGVCMPPGQQHTGRYANEQGTCGPGSGRRSQRSQAHGCDRFAPDSNADRHRLHDKVESR